MTKDEQKQFIENYMQSIKDDMLKDVDNGKVPEEWDGIELREWVREIAVSEAYWFNGKRRQKRYQNFKNDIIVNNLK